jgi:putative transposase
VPQSFTKLLFHVVFSTKNREPWIAPQWKLELYSFVGGVVRNRNGELLAVGGVADHLHLLVRLPPTRAPADVIRDIKSNSSGWLHERNVFPFAWQDGYGAFTLGPSAVRSVRAYIDNQEAHHARHSFADEREALLSAAGATDEERAAWE